MMQSSARRGCGAAPLVPAVQGNGVFRPALAYKPSRTRKADSPVVLLLWFESHKVFPLERFEQPISRIVIPSVVVRPTHLSKKRAFLPLTIRVFPQTLQ